jgi:GT2 family glycosyltransferase
MQATDIDLLLPPIGLARTQWCAFDHLWYLKAYPAAAEAIGSSQFSLVRQHYVDIGAAQGLSPNIFFDEAWYCSRYPDIAAAIAGGEVASGYVHYCLAGYGDRAPHWLFDPETYAAYSPDLTDAELIRLDCVNIYDHYLRIGMLQGRLAHLLFAPSMYRDSHGDAADRLSEIDRAGAFVDFLSRRFDRAHPEPTVSIYFDPAWFAARHVVGARGALHAYLTRDSATPCDPVNGFDEAFYRDQHPEVTEAMRLGTLGSGYEHFLKFGALALLAPNGSANLRAYHDSDPAIAAAIAAGRCRDAFAHWRAVSASIEVPLAPLRHGCGQVVAFGTDPQSGMWMLAAALTGADPNLSFAGKITLRATFADTVLTGEADYVVDQATGTDLIVAVRGAAPAGRLRQVEVSAGRWVWRLVVPTTMAALPTDAVLADMLERLGRLDAANSTPLSKLLRRTPFAGHGTLDQLRPPVLMNFDQAILCRATVAGARDGVALLGWLIAPGGVQSITVQCGGRATLIKLDQMIRVPRPDVLQSLAGTLRVDADAYGFTAFVPDAIEPGETPHLVVETTSGDIGYSLLPPFRLQGLAAIEALLVQSAPRYDEVAPSFDHVYGPAVSALNAARLHAVRAPRDIALGPIGAPVMLSVVVPLFGRTDFMEYQVGLFAHAPPGPATEFIYVLDDPALEAEAEYVAASVAARFNVPIRLLILTRNLGYGPATNVGLRAARGNFVALLNSDVFPIDAGWGTKLILRLQADPKLGAVGPQLLFEDGTVQHQGMAMEALPEFGGLRFPLHMRKGLRPEADTGLRPVEAITGAAMVMRRRDLLALGGLDEAYAIGDFEDADLCRRLEDKGLTCAVDLGVRMYHLERQTQGLSGRHWRMNLTLFNAWVYNRRWATQADAQQ